MAEHTTDTPGDPEKLAAIDAARGFIETEAPHLTRLFNIDGLDIEVGDDWKTLAYTDGSVKMTVDPSFFIEQGYEPEWAVYGTLHEVVAHVREALWEPLLTKKVGEFAGQGEPQSIFHNILSDIAGNKAIHARLPRMAGVAEDVYRRRQMPDDPPPMEDPLEQYERYRDRPRHLQFLYKMIREEMMPGCHTVVLDEVDQALARLRDYQGSGQDAIKYSTDVAKPDGSPTTPEERFGLWLTVIYPEFEALLEMDRQDPKFQKEDDDMGRPSDKGQGEQGNPQDGKPQNQGEADGDQFKEHYDDYRQNRHPEPLSKEAHEALHEAAEKVAKAKRDAPSPTQKLDQRIQEETGGHRLFEQRTYNQELIRYRDQVEAMRELFFRRVISPQITIRRRLGKTLQQEGAILDPNHLAETIAETKSGTEEPAAFLDYEHRRASGDTIGNTDYFLVIDRSSSMAEDGGKKAQAAGSCTMIFLEGLAGIQHDIEEAEAEHGIELGMSVSSSVVAFGDGATVLKPLSDKLETKERLDSYQAAREPLQEGTADYLALEAIANMPREDEGRRRIIVVLTDGESNDAEKAGKVVRKLRASENTYIYAISIGSDEAVALYKPDAQRCDDPAKLPETLGKLLEETLA